MRLPEGFDEIGSRFFVEPDLRPIYEQIPELAPRDAAWVVKRFARFEPAEPIGPDLTEFRDAHRDVIRLALHWHYLVEARARHR